MLIYDAHIHIGGSADPNPKELLSRLNACGITGGNVLSINPDNRKFTFEERMDNLFRWTDGYEDRLFPVAWLHPDEDDVIAKARLAAKRGVAAFKFLPNTYSVGEEKPLRLFREIEDLGKPILFHSGILYDFLESSKYNKPLNWECFAGFRNLRFSLGHCGHPWYDEGIMVYGKFDWMRYHAACAADGTPTIYRNEPWIEEHLTEDGGFEAPACYLDTTPGAHGLFRKDMLAKLVSCYPKGDRIFFGTDMEAEIYPSALIAVRLEEERRFLDEAGATGEFRRKMYAENLFEFLGSHR